MAKSNITLYRNSTQPMKFIYVEDMTGGTMHFTVKNVLFDSSNPDATAMPKVDVTSFTEGGTVASWSLSDLDTYLDPGKYFYDIVFEDALGRSTPPLFLGSLTIKGHPTNRGVLV